MHIKKEFFAVGLIIFIISGGALSYYLINEKNYNSILMEFISGEVVKESDTFEGKVRLLRNYVHGNIHPVQNEENRLDTVGIDKLVSGIGWCDQASRVFMQLAKKQGITTRLLFLLAKDGSSPHSVAEAWDGKSWVLIDLSYDLELRNSQGKMASMSDIKDDFGILLNNSKVKIFASHNSHWNNREYLSMYYRKPSYINTKKGSRFRPLGHIPSFLRKFLIYTIQETYIFKKRKEFSDPDEFLYFKTRNYHLVGRAEEAEGLYIKILNNNNPSSLTDKTRFFLAILLRDQNRVNESVQILTDLVRDCKNPHWLPYAYGLRSHLYQTLGNKENAQEDFVKFASLPDAYF